MEMFRWSQDIISSTNNTMKCKISKGESILITFPSDVLTKIIDYLPHVDIHHLESTHSRFREHFESSHYWRQNVIEQLAWDKTQWVHASAEKSFLNQCIDNKTTSESIWKRLACLISLSSTMKFGQQDLIVDVLKFSSTDRESESPANTLHHSRCWGEIRQFQHGNELVHPYDLQELTTFSMFRLLTRRQSSLGETIQMLCGCSSGNSCYWSSAASTSPAAEESIYYRMRGHCIVRAIIILPYRVFWHPGAPTYGPRQVTFSFFANVNNVESEYEAPFYVSPVYDVVNDMMEQSFELPHCIMLQDGYIRVNFIGRHQAQTFDIPAWMQPQQVDNQPKYYCCVSKVSAKGVLMRLEDALTP